MNTSVASCRAKTTAPTRPNLQEEADCKDNVQASLAQKYDSMMDVLC
jgi:hypothetical protein